MKPGNVLLDGNDHVKVTDFGIARAANTKENLTQTGAVMGTATYFSPEQAQGYGVDPRSDVYSLGVVLYEMVTGRPPFAGDNPLTIAYKHVREAPVPPRQVNPAIPAAFEAIILQAMAKDPDDRYATADELRADLVRYQQGRPVMANPVTWAEPEPEPAATMVQPASRDRTVVNRTRVATGPAPGPPPPEGPNRTGTYVILLFAMLAALVLLLFLLGRTLGIFGDETSTEPVTVPNVVGKDATSAGDDIVNAGLKIRTEREPSPTVPEGDVIRTTPDPGTEVERNSTVVLFVSSGPAPTTTSSTSTTNPPSTTSSSPPTTTTSTTIPPTSVTLIP